MRRAAPLSLLLASAWLGCSGEPSSPKWYEVEAQARAAIDGTVIGVDGTIVDAEGAPVAGATVRVGSQQSSSAADGSFELTDLPRQNALLVIEANGYHVEHVPTHLLRPIDQSIVQLPTVILASRSASRLIMGGDVALGRRFLDPEGVTPRGEMPPGHPDALIQTSDPLPGTQAVLEHMRPMLEAADLAAVNLEAPVTTDLSAPDVDNSYVFFILPGSLPGLAWAGIDYVSLANNHIYDYGEPGLLQTLANLDAAGLAHSGAGTTPIGAIAPQRLTANGVAWSILSAVSIEGIPVRNAFAANDEHGGAADLNDDDLLRDAITTELAAGRTPVATVHTGYEYTEHPPADGYTSERFEFLAEAGAELVVGHHPHVPQGFAAHNGVLIAHSLGNFAFDQERLETLLALMLQVDHREGGPMQARARGLYIEDYVPRPVTGAWHQALLRRAASSSHDWGAVVAPHGEEAFIGVDAADFVTMSRSQTIPVTIGERGWTIVDLRPLLQAGESLAAIEAHDGLMARSGQDLLIFGDMEDLDVDEDRHEVSPWYSSELGIYGPSFPCVHDAYRGTAAMCLVRTSHSVSPATTSVRSRTRVLGDKLNLPNKDLSLVFYANGENAGLGRVEVGYLASIGDEDFGVELPVELPTGTFPWTRYTHDLAMPADDPAYPRDPADPFNPELRIHNARAIKLRFHHGAPLDGEGIVRLDDVALVSWLAPVDLGTGAHWTVPHPRDFVRIEGTPGEHQLHLELARLVPRAVAPR